MVIIDINQVSSDEREKAKTISLEIIYGIGPERVGNRLNIYIISKKINEYMEFEISYC